MNEFSELVDTYKDWGGWRIEKCLEHYLSYKLLNMKKKDILIIVY